MVSNSIPACPCVMKLMRGFYNSCESDDADVQCEIHNGKAPASNEYALESPALEK